MLALLTMNQAHNKLIKPWSISTTVRNPERLRGFLEVLSGMEGKKWDKETQIEFQINLIAANKYNTGLLGKAIENFHKKEYKDSPMRGRNSFKPLEKFGFATRANKIINITDSGKTLLEHDANLGEILLKCLLKWQLPNPVDKAGFPKKYGYDIKPFIATLHLICEVNKLCRKNGESEKGLSFWEFQWFAITLVNYREIKKTAEKIMEVRRSRKKEAHEQAIIQKMRSKIPAKTLKDYADNALRYFRATQFIRLLGANHFIDLEPLRKASIDALLDLDKGQANIAEEEYQNILTNPKLPVLPWESSEHTKKSAEIIITHIKSLGVNTKSLPNFQTMGIKEQKNYLEKLRGSLKLLQEEKDKQEMQTPEKILEISKNLLSLQNNKEITNKPLLLEHFIALGLVALNDAIKIKPNCPRGDDNMPYFTAPAGKADIECYYKDFSAICEVTMSCRRDQWVQEGQPVLRHLNEFENQQNQETFCIFVAPIIHPDTANTFLFATKGAYENKKKENCSYKNKRFLFNFRTLCQKTEARQAIEKR